MIEIEINPTTPESQYRELRVWINGDLVYANAMATPLSLQHWRDALHNELLWIDGYMRKGWSNRPSLEDLEAKL
jgi:hypothetical protein